MSARYGASRATRTTFVRDVRALGLSARFDPSGVFAPVSGTVNQLERIFKVPIRSVFGNAPNVVVWSLKPGSQLTLPRSLRPLVQDIVPYVHPLRHSHGRADRGSPAAGATNCSGIRDEYGGAAADGNMDRWMREGRSHRRASASLR